MPDDLRLLIKAIRLDRNRSLRWGLALLPSGGYLCLFWHLGGIPGIALPITGAVLILIALKLFYEVARYWAPHTHPLYQLVRHHKPRIVWVYSVATQVSPFGINLFDTGEIFFKLDDGQEITLNLPDILLQPLSESLNHVLPQTTFGYTEERDQWYAANPILLRK